MFITKKHLPRRTFLRGMGVTLALPLLDSMIPARTLLAQTAAKPAAASRLRLRAARRDHGQVDAGHRGRRLRVHADPQAARAASANYVNVVSGLGHKAADTTAVHSLSPTTWLSGVRPKATQGVDAFAGITADQIAAQAIGQDTPLPSMELATEDHSGLIGSCDRDYGCIYMNTLSWRTPTTPLPMEINPRKVFERMFGAGRQRRRARGAHPGRPQHPRRDHQGSGRPAAAARAVRSPDDDAVSRERARDRAPHPARREEPGRRGSAAAGAPGRRAVRLRGARRG